VPSNDSVQQLRHRNDVTMLQFAYVECDSAEHSMRTHRIHPTTEVCTLP
jgi:hypothetical protein